ncbi:MAG: hypothetical protein WCP96_09130 [Methylococcaceae bacterium]
MIVRITDKESGDLLIDYPIILRNIGGQPVTESEYFDEAWQNVIDDNLISLSTRDDFNFELIH